MKPKWSNFTDEEIRDGEKQYFFLQLQREMGYSDKGGSATERIRNMLDERALIILTSKVTPGIKNQIFYKSYLFQKID